jgi:hypothetical protein
MDGEAQVHLVGRDVAAESRQVRGLDAVEKDQEGQDFVVRNALRRLEQPVVLHILGEVDFLRNPEIVHGLPIPVADPLVLEVVEVVEVGGVAVDEAAAAGLDVTGFIEQGLSGQVLHN